MVGADLALRAGEWVELAVGARGDAGAIGAGAVG